MSGSLLFIIPLVIVIAGAFVLFLLLGRKGNKDGSPRKKKNRDRNAIVREANRKLSQNPRDADALKSLGDVYYQEESFDKALKTFEILIDLCATNKSLDEFEITVKYAVSALKTKHYKEAYKSLLIARSMRNDVFEVNHHLGYLEYARKNYEKAIALLRQAWEAQPDHADTLKYLGMAYYRTKRYDQATRSLRQLLEVQPDDKEALFALGRSYYELNQLDRAVQILSRLRADPDVGPNAALYAGTIHMNMNRHEDAAMDFEIGLRHESIKDELKLELMYRAGTAYVQMKKIGDALKYFQEIYKIDPEYRDVAAQLNRYREMNLNQHLQTYLLGTTSEFVALCRTICALFFPDAKLTIVDVAVQKSEYIDILAEVSTSRWEDTVLFRYIRASSRIGELSLRDMYARIKELKAGRGFCISAGGFTDTAQQFVEARLIDLVDKEELTKMLNRL